MPWLNCPNLYSVFQQLTSLGLCHQLRTKSDFIHLDILLGNCSITPRFPKTTSSLSIQYLQPELQLPVAIQGDLCQLFSIILVLYVPPKPIVTIWSLTLDFVCTWYEADDREVETVLPSFLLVGTGILVDLVAVEAISSSQIGIFIIDT